MSTPTTSSLLTNLETDLKKVETKVETFFTYTLDSAVTNIKNEVDKLETFITSKTKTIEKNLDTIKSLTAENASHSADVSKASDTVSKLKSAVS